MEADPFKDLVINDASFLDNLEGRTACSKCGRTRKYYCYTCYVPVGCLQDKLPKVKLPVKVDVIKHPSEVDGKSTAVHAAIICPEDVKIYTYPVIPDYPDPSKVILIFPGDKSVTLEELAECLGPRIESEESEPLSTSTGHDTPSSPKKLHQQNSGEGPADTVHGEQSTVSAETKPSQSVPEDKIEGRIGTGIEGSILTGKRTHEAGTSRDEPLSKKLAAKPEPPFERVVFIDSTWNQTMKIYKDERLRGLRQVELKSRTTNFWRHQRDKPSTYLATIEAMYYFLQDYHRIFIGGEPKGCYDNLLFFFAYMYQKIRTLYSGGETLKAYKERKSSSAPV